MASPDDNESSTDLVLLYLAPQPLAHAYRRAQSQIGDARERLGWRLGLADAIQRFLVSVLACEAAGLGLQPPADYLKLINKLESPSLGDWSKAAHALAQAVLGSGHEPVVSGLPELLVLRTEDGSLARTPLADHLKFLVDLRNQLFHRDGAPLPDERTAERKLAEIAEPLRETCRALRILRDYPVLCLREKVDRRDGTSRARLLRFIGGEAGLLVCSDAAGIRLPANVPFMLSARGDALFLSPFMEVASSERGGGLELRLVYGWSGEHSCFVYSDVHGGTNAAIVPEASPEIRDGDELRALSRELARHDGAVPSSHALDWREQLFEEAPPTLRGFKIENLIGRGGTSTVWIGREIFRDRPPGPHVALKVLHPTVARDARQRTRLRSEHEVLRSLIHPNIVTVQRLEESPDQVPFLVMDYVPGEDLMALGERRRLKPSDAVRLVSEVLSALALVHAHKIIHRDVKPSNVIVDRQGRARLIDFGIALTDSMARATLTLEALGTLAFAAPEQHRGQADLDARADIYAVGRMLEFLLLGETAPPGGVAPGLPSGLHAVVRRATQLDRSHRYESALDMRADLDTKGRVSWGGAPVAEGDRLDRSFEIGGALGTEDDLHVFDGAELQTGDPVTIVLAPSVSCDAGKRLHEAVKLASDAVRSSVGFRALIETYQDGLLYAVLGASDGRRRARCLLQRTVYVAPEADGPSRPLSPPAPPSCPPYLYGSFRFLHKVSTPDPKPPDPTGDILTMRRHTELLLQVIFVQSQHLCLLEDPARLVTWPPLRPSLNLAVVLDLLHGIAPDSEGVLRPLLALYENAVTTRNALAHGQRVSSTELVKVRSAFSGVMSGLLEVAVSLGRRLSTKELSPYIAELEPGVWAVLTGGGSRLAYARLDEAMAVSQAPEPVSQVIAEANKPPRESARSTVTALLADWPLASTAIREAGPEYFGPLGKADWLIMDRDDRPLCVIEELRSLERESVVAVTDKLWKLATAVQAPYAAVTDGVNWRWFGNSVSQGLVWLRERPAAATSTAAPPEVRATSTLGVLRRKLIEVALPITEISKAGARERALARGHPFALHTWWSRRPLTVCRGILFGQLVDDPSAWPEEFPSEAAQDRERRRLLDLMIELVQWKNNESHLVLDTARLEIARSIARGRRGAQMADRRDLDLLSGESIPLSELSAYLAERGPTVFDPFVGGGSIPLEAQRLGLRSKASDLNPVSVTIVRALVDTPNRFRGRAAVLDGPTVGFRELGERARGLAADVRSAGHWMQTEARRRIGASYPLVELPNGDRAPVMAWLWVRTVPSPDAAFDGAHVPIASTFDLCTKEGREAWVEPVVSGRSIRFEVRLGRPSSAVTARGTKVGRGVFRCLLSGLEISAESLRRLEAEGKTAVRLMAIVVKGKSGPTYLAPTAEHERLALEATPPWTPAEEIDVGGASRALSAQGVRLWSQLYSSRQLLAMTTFSDLVGEVRAVVIDAAKRSMPGEDTRPLNEGGTGAVAYGDAVATYMALAVDRAADAWSSAVTWATSGETFRTTFAYPVIRMGWDFAEANPFSESAGSFDRCVERVADALEMAPAGPVASVSCHDATQPHGPGAFVTSTDPPYYDNVLYSELSDFFYIWLRQSLKSVYPDLLAAETTSKSAELVAARHRYPSRNEAEKSFNIGMRRALGHLANSTLTDVPMALYYSFKRNQDVGEGAGNEVSTTWEQFLASLIESGFSVVGTWPISDERPGRAFGKATSSVSSVVLVCRRRTTEASVCTREELAGLLRRQLPGEINVLARHVAADDLRMAALGPGMAIFSRQQRVLESDGSTMSVRAAIDLIAAVLNDILAPPT